MADANVGISGTICDRKFFSDTSSHQQAAVVARTESVQYEMSVSRLTLSFEVLYLVLSSLLSIQVTTEPTALSLVIEFSWVNQLTGIYPEQANYNRFSKIPQQERENLRRSKPRDVARRLNTRRIDGSITRHARKGKHPFGFLQGRCHDSHTVVVCLFMPKFPCLHCRLISDFAFSAAQFVRRTGVPARLRLLLLVPAFPFFLPPVSPFLLKEKTVISTYVSLFSPKRFI